jgi:ABC-type Zn2+ transport system substrate-binding protein/surface adhesin
MSTRTMKMLGVGIAAIAFLLVTIPLLKSSVAYADSGDHNKDHGDHGDHDHDHDHGDHGDHDHDHDHNKDHGDHHNDRDQDRDKK